MLRNPAPVADLPTPLLDALTEHRRGLREVRLKRGRGRAGFVATDVSWSLLGATSGEPTKHDEEPDTDPEEIAREVLDGAAEVMTTQAGSKERRFAVDLGIVDEQGKVTRHEVGFELAEDAAWSSRNGGRLTMESELAGLVRELRTLVSDAYREVNLSHRAMTSNVRAVGSMFQTGMQLRLEAFDDHAHAALYGVGRPRKEDAEWKEKSYKMANNFMGVIAAAAGGDSSKDKGDKGSSGGERKLRDALAELGQTITDSQKASLIAAVGIGTMKLLLDAGNADSDPKAAKILHEFLGELTEKKSTAIESVLSDEQVELLEAVLQTHKSMMTIED